MFNLKTFAVAVALSASALVSTAPAADARQKVVVIEQVQRPHHARENRRDRHNARDYRAARRAEARRDRRHDRRHERRYDRRNNGPGIILQVR